MAKFFLMNTIRLGTQVLLASSLIDPAVVDPAPIIAAGGSLWPTTDAVVAAAAAVAQSLHRNGANETTLDTVMGTAGTKSLATGSKTSYLTVDDLGLIDASGYAQGFLAYVAQLDRYFEWVPGALASGVTAGPTSAFADSSLSGYWVTRPSSSPKWIGQTGWEVSSTGDDRAKGDSSAPLATFAEWYRRTNGDHLTGTTIQIDDDLGTTDRVVYSVRSVDKTTSRASLNITGKYTAGQTGTVTSYTAPVVTEGAQARAQIVLTGAVIAAGARVLVYVGSTTAVRSIVHINSSLGGTTYDLGAINTGTPQGADTYAVVPYVQLRLVVSHSKSTVLTWTNVSNQTAQITDGLNDVFVDCRIPNGQFTGSHGALYSGCQFDTTALTLLEGGEWFFQQCSFRGVALTQRGGSLKLIDCVVSAGAGFELDGLYSEISGATAFYGCTATALYLRVGTKCRLLAGTTLSGTGNLVGCNVGDGCLLSIPTGIVVTLQGTTELLIGGQATVVPFVSGIPTGAAVSCNTFAKVKAAPFAENAANLPTGSFISATV